MDLTFQIGKVSKTIQLINKLTVNFVFVKIFTNKKSKNQEHCEASSWFYKRQKHKR